MRGEEVAPTHSPTSPTPSAASPLIDPTQEQVHAHFAPYRRISPPWTLYERVKTCLVLVLLLPFRILYLILSTAFILLIATIAVAGIPPIDSASPKSEQYDPNTDPLLMPLSSWRKALLSLIFPIARSTLFFSFAVYHIRLDKADFISKRAEPEEKAYVIVANHLGYIDILVMLCMFRASFVAKGELEHSPIIGCLARALQCMFVRKGRSLTAQLVTRVQSTDTCHRQRVNCPGCPACLSKLVIFPEGTTTNGTAMVPFRTGIFNAAVPVKPVCIKFPYSNFNLSWETIRFREHLFRTMTQLVNYVHVIELPVYVPSPDEIEDARLFAANVQKECAAVLNQPVVLLNRKQKFLYHSWILGKEQSAADVLEKSDRMFSEDEQLVYFADNRVLGNV